MIEGINERIDNIEKTLDIIKDNHLRHIERYTLVTLCGIIVSVGISMCVLIVTIL